MTRDELFDHLRDNTQVLSTEALETAFETIDRIDFIPEDYKVEAYEDYALPIGLGEKTIQPSTVAFMLELLDVNPGDRVLNIGAGSGYSTALLSIMAGPEGSVLGLEIVPELAELARANIIKYEFPNTTVIATDARWSPTELETYDKILVNAAADELPASLIPKLNVGGTLVIPIADTIFRIQKISEEEIVDEAFPGFTFDTLT